ncbi:MAG: lactate racemase domain-containing protein [Acidobacteriota bacterium]|nr:lactate racemase domain-containing protein [Acidobacteriota bacterium]
MPAPRGVTVRQSLSPDHIEDVRGSTKERLLAAGLRDKLKPGARIAITAGSRGMGGFVELLAGIADAVRTAGGEPFLIPAMGSHGGAVPEGQTEILNRLGASENAVNAPIHASMDTVLLGTSESGAVAHFDKLAFEADGVIVLGRVKTHPESAAELASGLLKMCTIGLGKQSGAQEAHTHKLWDSVRAVPKLQLAKSKILFGVAVVENGYRQPVEIEVVPANYEAFLEADMRLLKIAKTHLGTIPFDRLDLLVVDEIGKNISGSGMDLNVIGHWRASNGPQIPNFHRIAVLSLTHPSLGNGLGVGLADFTTQRFLDSYDPGVTYINLMTATEPGGTTREGPLPLALPSDRDAIEVSLFSALGGKTPRVCRIRNTGSLEQIWVSEALLPEVKQNAKLSAAGEPASMTFDANGNLF